MALAQRACSGTALVLCAVLLGPVHAAKVSDAAGLIKRDTLPFAGDQAKEALNFNITILIAGAALVLFSIVTVGIGLVLAVPLGFVLFFYWLIFTIIAAVNANNGVRYRYPLTLRLIQ